MGALARATNLAAYARYTVDAGRHAATATRSSRFALLGVGRNGSTLLTELLNSHPMIHCDGEILTERVAAPRLVVAGRAMRSAKPAYGFKLLTYQVRQVQRIEPAVFLGWLRGRGYQLFHLRRRNVLRQALSNINARAHGFHHRGSLPEAARQAIHVDVEELQYWLDLLSLGVTFHDELLADIPHVEFVYEDDLADRAAQQRTVDRVCRTLELPYEPVSTDLVRVTPDRLADLVANYDEVAAYLAGTPYEQYLDR